MKRLQIALYPGDGIGPEVVDQTVRVLRHVEGLCGGFQLEMTELPWGSRHYTEHGAVVPENYLRAATQTNDFIKASEPEEKWGYGHGFWINDYGVQWPDLPRDSFAAQGAGAKMTWVCPSLDLVITQNPGPRNAFEGDERDERVREILGRIIDALKG